MMENKTVLQKPGFWRLVGAYVLDLIIIGVTSQILLMMLVMVISIIKPQAIQIGNSWFFSILFIANILFPLSYFAFVEGITGSSVGKKTVKLYLQATHLSWWRVLISYVIDIVGLQVVCWGTIWGLAELSVDPFALSGIFVLLSFFLLFYFPLTEYLFGKTLGKKLMGLTVVQAAPETEPTTAQQAAPVKQEEETK